MNLEEIKIIISIDGYHNLSKRFSAYEYLRNYQNNNNRVIIASFGTPWIQYEKNAFIRFPIYSLNLPEEKEIEEIFEKSKASLISFNLKSTGADSFIYVCRDNNYSYEKLPSNMKRNIKRATKEFEFIEVKKSDFIKNGWKAYQDTRIRAGLNDGNKEYFLRQYKTWINIDTNRVFGLIKESQIASFITVSEIDNWIEIGLYSTTEYLSLRPNDLLIYKVLEYYLLNKKFSFVSFGSSSIQPTSSLQGLHQFKLKVGFEAIPIRRIFYLNPKLRFLNNRFIKIVVKTLVKLNPSNRKLRKLDGILGRII